MNEEKGFRGTAHLQDKIADIDTTRQLVARYLTKRKADAIKLLAVNGVKIDKSASLKTVTAAFLQAIYSSDSFRTQASQALSGYALSLKKASFTGSYRNTIGIDEEYINEDEPWLGTQPIGTNENGPAATTATPTATTTPSSSGGSFWDTLGGIFSKDVIQTGIKTGLGALSTSISSNANNTSQQNALAIEQAKLAQIQAAAALKNTPDAGKAGLSTGWKIAIGVGVAAVITTMIILIVRKK